MHRATVAVLARRTFIVALAGLAGFGPLLPRVGAAQERPGDAPPGPDRESAPGAPPPEPPVDGLRPVSAEEAAELFAWFDTLGLPDAWGRPFGAAASGACERSGDDPWTAVEEFAWLIEDRGASFRVLTITLEVRELTKSPGRDPYYGGADRVGFEPRDMDAEAEAQLEAALEDIRGNVTRLWGPHNPGVFVPASVRLLVLARALRARGAGARARELLAAARGLECMGADLPLRESLVPGLAHVLTGRIVMALADPANPRADVLARAEVALAGLGESEVTAELKELVVILRRMVEEDRTHRPPEGFPDACPPAAAAREWAWRLRDQGGHQMGQPGYCDIFVAEGESGEPANRLLALGTGAVPALIDAFEDDRVIRAASESWGSPTPYTVAGAARQVLYRIAGRGFESREAAMAWWTDVQERGLDAVLLEGIRLGDGDAFGQAEILAGRSPRAVVDALEIGLPKCVDVIDRRDLVILLGGIEGDAPLPLLLAEAAASPSLPARVAAAEALLKRGRSEGVAHLMEAWRTATNVYGTDDLMRFLVECGDPAALRALGASVPGIHVTWRIQVLLEIHDTAEHGGIGGGPGGEWKSEAERILAAALQDRDVATGYWSGFDRVSLDEPRVCDVAALVLAGMRGTPEALDLASSVTARDRACLRLGNAWRKEQGLELLPEPPRPAIPPAGRAVGEFLDVVKGAKDTGGRAPALAGLRLEGLGALAPVEAALALLPADHPARGDLEAVARDLAFTVREAAADPAGLPVPDSVQVLLDRMRGRLLSAEDMTGLVSRALKDLPEAARGIEILLDRPEDRTGVALRIALLPAASKPGSGMTPPPGGWPRESSPRGWSDWVSVIRAGEPLECSVDSSGDSLLAPGGWSGLGTALAEGMKAGPGEPLEVRGPGTR